MYSRLRSEIKNQNLSIRQVAIKAGIVPQALYAAINGRCEFWPGWRTRVANVMGVPEEDLFSEIDVEEMRARKKLADEEKLMQKKLEAR